MKTPLAQLYRRSVVGGRRYSRSPTDTNPPTTPILADPVANTTYVDVAWTNGVDAETGIQDALVEIRRNGTTSWTQVIVPYIAGDASASSYRFTGLSSGTPYDIRVANRDNAATPNVSSYSSIKTVSTLAVATDTAPGLISFSTTTYALAGGIAFTIDVTRTGAGANSSAVEADWAFSGFSEGTPSPANGTLSWAAGQNNTQTISGTAGAVTATRSGQVRIVAVRATDGTLAPSLGTSQATVTIAPASIVRLHYDDFQAATWDGAKQGEAAYAAARWGLQDDYNIFLDSRPEPSTNHVRTGVRSLRYQLTNPYPDTSKKLGTGEWPHRIEGVAKAWPTTGWTASPALAPSEYWYAFSIYLDSWTAADSLGNYEIFWQIHDAPDPKEISRNPMLSLRMIPPNNGTGAMTNWGLQILSSAIEIQTKRTYERNQTYDLGSWASDVDHWTDWVFRVRYWYDFTNTKALLQIWKNGVLVFAEIGKGNCFNDVNGRVLHLGLYRSPSDNGSASEPAQRVWYVGEHQIALVNGNPYALVDSSNPGYIAVAPRGTRT